MKLQRIGTGGDAPGRRRAARRPAWLRAALLLAFVGLVALHVSLGGAPASAAGQPGAGADIVHWDDEPCDSGHAGPGHDGVCLGAGGCTFCVPVTPHTALLTVACEPARAEWAAIRPGIIIFPHFRPPKPVTRV